jgi:hypothetical protein
MVCGSPVRSGHGELTSMILHRHGSVPLDSEDEVLDGNRIESEVEQHAFHVLSIGFRRFFHNGLGIPVNTATGEEWRARELVVLPEERVTKGVDVIMRNWGMGLHRRRKGARP